MYKKFSITWLKTKIVKKRKKVWAGFCGKTKHLFSVAPDNLTPLVVSDFLIQSDGTCEEGKRCLYFACPLNTTSPESYLFDIGFRKRKTKKDKPANVEMGEIVFDEEYFGELKGGIITGKDGAHVFELFPIEQGNRISAT